MKKKESKNYKSFSLMVFLPFALALSIALSRISTIKSLSVLPSSKSLDVLHPFDLIYPLILDFTTVQPITFKKDDDEDVICICVIIAQTSQLIGVKHDNDTIKYVLRTSSGTVPVDPQVIIDKKKDIRRTNFNFIRVINDRLTQNS